MFKNIIQTINKEQTISGVCLMSGKECTVTLFPSEERGIRFYTANSKTPILASCEDVTSTNNCVVLGNVVLIEHFMAACSFAGINSLDVCMSSFEMPILDGSAIEWYKILDKKTEMEETVFEKPIATSNMVLIPSDSLKITYCINMNHPELKNRWVSYDLSKNNEVFLEARTFGYLKDLEKFQQAGMALGVSKDNTVGLTEDGYTTPLRSEFEPVKHKILDLIGDLSLTGRNPLGFKAHIIATEAGHKSHVELASLL